MFFSTELLTKRESGLGLLWLAATIGSKASFKKLNKRSIISANISKLCDMIAEPEEPLALRLSSNLLVGVARVHRAQHEIFYNDVMTCFATLKRAFVEITAAENQLQGQLAVSKEQLTLRDTGFDIELDVLDAAWLDPVARQQTPSLTQDDFETRVIPAPEKPPSRPSQGSHSADERRRLNLLPENVMDFSGPSDDPFRDQDEQLFDGEQVDLGLDLGLDFGGDQGQVGGYDGDQGVYHDEFHPLNDEQDRLGDGSVARHASTVTTPLQLRHGLTEASLSQPITPSSALVFGDPAAPDVSSSGHTNHSQFLELALAEDAPPPAEQAPAPKPSAKKRKKHIDMPLWDEKIELTEAELLQNREGYEERMKKERREMRTKQRRFEAANLVQSMMQGPLLGAIDAGLVSWYKGIVRAQHDAFSNRGRAQIDDGFAVPALPKKRRKTGKKDKEDEAVDPPYVELPASEFDVPNGFPSDDTNGGGVPFDDQMDWTHDVPNDGAQPNGSAEPEQARRGSSVPSSDLGSHLGRKAHYKPPSLRSSNPPWEPAPAIPVHEGMETPGGLRRARSASAVQVGHEGEDGLDLDHSFTFEEQTGFDNPGDVAAGADDSQMTDMSLITMQRTMDVGSAKFLTHLVTSVDPESKSISFGEYLAPGAVDRRVAAMGFYHVLDLTTKHRLRAHQGEAYGPIKLTVL